MPSTMGSAIYVHRLCYALFVACVHCLAFADPSRASHYSRLKHCCACRDKEGKDGKKKKKKDENGAENGSNEGSQDDDAGDDENDENEVGWVLWAAGSI